MSVALLSGCQNKVKETDVPAVEQETKEQQPIEVIPEKEEEPTNQQEPTDEQTNEPTKNEVEEQIEEETSQNNNQLETQNRDKNAIIESAKGLDNKAISWQWRRNKEHTPPEAYADVKQLSTYGGYYLGNTEEKVVYLTFDNGYENGFTAKILDTLKEKGVKAAFFVTKSYIKKNPDLVKRMKEEGHIVGNHSVTHPKFTEVSLDQVYEEIKGVETYMEETLGYKLDPYFRPPSGVYNEQVLGILNKMGYKTIVWSMAYKDWLVDEQPGKEAALDHVMTNYHPGMISLLHAVSESNTEALGDIIDGLRGKGYKFATLDELN